MHNADFEGENWAIYNADTVEVIADMPDHSVGFCLYSPPFGDLFVYSQSERDMGNSSSNSDFFNHYRFMLNDLLRVMKPGRIVGVHCSDLPLRKGRDGHIGLYDFSGDLVRAHADAGFIYHSRTTIWKDPVVEMQRTKAIGLLHKQLKKDSVMSRTGMPDYMLWFRAPGDNAEPISHDAADVPVELWQQWASPVWMNIRQSDVLNGRLARGNEDEKHICPLQLDLIERSLRLYSRPGDVVLDPFNGIGSTGYQAVRLGRKYIGNELKPEYAAQAAKFLSEAERAKGDLFAAGAV
jgi:hypothetical protein